MLHRVFSSFSKLEPQKVLLESYCLSMKDLMVPSKILTEEDRIEVDEKLSGLSGFRFSFRMEVSEHISNR